jgi:ATP-dependent Zn protease
MKIAICSVAMICLVALWWITTVTRPGWDKLTYSQFLEQVRTGKVASVIVIDNRSGVARATLHLRDGKTARTVLPTDYQDALAAMQDKLVNIEIQGGPSFANAVPFLLLLAVWFLVILGKFHGFRRTCGADGHVGKPAV